MSSEPEIEEITLTIPEFINRVSTELDFIGTKGVYGNELELIALVRNCQFLYDKSLSDFKNIQKKNEAWKAIAEVFGVSVGNAQQRWNTLRDQYRRCKKKMDIDDKTATCPFYDDLKFLEPYIVGRKPCITGTPKMLMGGYPLKNSGQINFLSHEDVIKFIHKIESLPILYHSRYMSGTYRKQKIHTWIQVAKYFNLSTQECFARWRNLRERYSKERRQSPIKDPSRKWEWYEHLQFLDEHVKPRKRLVKPEVKSNDSSICYITAPESDSSSDPVNFDSSSLMNQSETNMATDASLDVEFFDISNEMKPSPQIYQEDSNTMHETEEQLADSSQPLKIPDEDDLFGQTIAAELKAITCPKKKMKLKSEIYKLLYESSCELPSESS